MSTFFTKLHAAITRCGAWYITNRFQIYRSFKKSCSKIGNCCKRIGNAVVRLLIVFAILMVAAHFCPSLREEFPTVYSLVEWLCIGAEFLIKAGLRFLYSAVRGNVASLMYESNKEAADLLDGFISWIQSL